MAKESLDAAYFAGVYARNADPWNFESSPYEREKYDTTLAALGGRHFACGFEIGCSIGVLTARLALLCATLVAIDIDRTALAAARERCRPFPHVVFEQAAFPHEVPSGRFDLVVVSEVAYYWSDADFALARERIALAAPGGTVVLVHFTPHVPDYVRGGDEVHEVFLADARFAFVRGERSERYRLDVLAVV